MLKTFDAESIDACVTDPPYGLQFMGKEWDRLWRNRSDADAAWVAETEGGLNSRRRHLPDYSASNHAQMQSFHEKWATEVFRILKPGAHLLACGGTRTYHRLACAIEDAGFEIRDCLAWLYGSGFPKSLNLGEGLGTALKPAHEPIVLARKPFKGSVAANVAQYGTGALNIDACRIEAEPWHREPSDNPQPWTGSTYAQDEWTKTHMGVGKNRDGHDLGRWPANVVIDEQAAMCIDEMSGESVSASVEPVMHTRKEDGAGILNQRKSCLFRPGNTYERAGFGDIGGASRFYYCAKPSREERDMGCYALERKSPTECTGRPADGSSIQSPRAGAGRNSGGHNHHPTVKPIELMRWLIRLVTPINGIVLDPFLGSGTTGIAARYEQRQFVGIEREAEYVAIAERRIRAAVPLFAEENQHDATS